MEKSNSRELILKTLAEKGGAKHDILVKSKMAFTQLKECLKDITADIKAKTEKVNKHIVVEYKDKGEYEAEVQLDDDILIFHLHHDVFDFDKSHGIWKTSYVNEENHNSFCGMITVFNFLHNSFKYDRLGDIGYMIARIFINKELHFFVEGKRQLGFLYNDFAHSVLDKEAIEAIIESAILYCLDFDLLTPPYDQMKEVRLAEMKELSNTSPIKIGKRLGYRFQADDDIAE